MNHVESFKYQETAVNNLALKVLTSEVTIHESC
jgi:hypothetical protein